MGFRNLVFFGQFREVCVFEAAEVVGQVAGRFWEEVICGGDEEDGWKEKACKDVAVPCEDGSTESGDTDIKQAGSHGFRWGDDRFHAVCGRKTMINCQLARYVS